jgi:hypothetical protein
MHSLGEKVTHDVPIYLASIALPVLVVYLVRKGDPVEAVRDIFSGSFSVVVTGTKNCRNMLGRLLGRIGFRWFCPSKDCLANSNDRQKNGADSEDEFIINPLDGLTISEVR